MSREKKMPAKNKPAAPKAFDVIAPGKAAPSPTGRPIIVSNRPMIKDLMEPSIKSRSTTAPPVGGDASRVGRTIGAAPDGTPNPVGQPSDPILSAVDADAPPRDDKRLGDIPVVATPVQSAAVVIPPKDPVPEPAPAKPAAAGSAPVAATAQPPAP